MNINKIIYKAIAQGYEGDPSSTNLLHIQDWIITKYKVVPCVNWDTKLKCWKAYVYEFDYDSVTWIKKLSNKQNITPKEATKLINKYIKDECVVTVTIYPNLIEGGVSKSSYTMDRFITSEQALYYAIEKAMDKINNKLL